jgi:hypothetical protein
MRTYSRTGAGRPRARLCALLVVVAALALPAGASAAGNASYTTFVDEAGCIHGSVINCNTYQAKTDVYMSGGPAGGNGLTDGDWFFAVIAPGSQNGGFLDGAAGNLSDTTDADGAGPDQGGGDAVSNRTFHVTGGNVDLGSYGGDHDTGYTPDTARPVIGLAPFDDTPNRGGVYILAICPVDSTDPSACKYDAFKVLESVPPPCDLLDPECQEVPPADALVVTKDANPSFDRTYTWNIGKTSDKTLVKLIGGSATFNYTVTVSRNAPTDDGYEVAGTISVLNPNDADVDGVDVTDAINDPSSTCVVSDSDDSPAVPATGGTIPANAQVDYAYRCTYSAAPDGSPQTNTATADWDAQSLLNGADLEAGPATFDVDFDWDTGVVPNPTLIDDCIDLTDPIAPAGTFSQTCVAGPTDYKYSRTVSAPQYGCVSYDNTAKYTTNTTATTGEASKTVTVCGPVRTGALTIGFWQNKNGQGIIKAGYSTNGVCNSATWLRQLAPFQDLTATSTCAQVATYVGNIIKAAVCTSSSKTCNSMLKAQMLATALDVYFSDPALGGNKIGASAPVGGQDIDLTKVCVNPLACSQFENTSSAFGGATHLTVSALLTSAASQSNSGGTAWYGQLKATQVLAKDTFDAINNQVAFAP